MLLHADHPVTVVDIEGFLNQFDGKKAALKDRCDRMLYDNNKIVLVDFYCGQQKFVPPYSNTQGEQPGKLAKARHQINSTVEKICEVPSINERIAHYATKEGMPYQEARTQPRFARRACHADVLEQHPTGERIHRHCSRVQIPYVGVPRNL